MSTTTLERLPNTVTACHVMIRKLQESAGDDGATAERDELKEKVEELEDECKSLQSEVERLEKYIEQSPDATDDINALLDECVRVGPLRFDVPQSDRAQRAIVALHDCVGRQP